MNMVAKSLVNINGMQNPEVSLEKADLRSLIFNK